jgi:hypothetical protein
MSYKHILTAHARDQFFNISYQLSEFMYSYSVMSGALILVRRLPSRDFLFPYYRPLFTADSVQELARAYYLAHGFSLYDQIAYDHMPGLAITYSLVLRALGLAQFTSPETLAAIERVGM